MQDPDGNGVELVDDLPNEVWEGDLNAALNYFDYMPNMETRPSKTPPTTRSSTRPPLGVMCSSERKFRQQPAA